MLEDATKAGFAAGEEIRVILELQGLKFGVVAGGAANTNQALAAIGASDTLASVLAFTPSTIKETEVAGTTATTNIAVAGIATADTLISVIRDHAGVLSDVTSEASITSAGNIQLSTTNTTGDTLLVTYKKAGAILADVTSTATIQAAGQLRNSVDTTGSTLLVVWHAKPAVQSD